MIVIKISRVINWQSFLEVYNFSGLIVTISFQFNVLKNYVEGIFEHFPSGEIPIFLFFLIFFYSAEYNPILDDCVEGSLGFFG